MTNKELNRSAVEQTLTYYLTHVNSRIRVSNVSLKYDKENEYEFQLIDSPILHLNDIQITSKVYIRHLKRNKKGIFNISLKDIEENTRIEIKNYFYFLKTKEPKIDCILYLKDYKDIFKQYYILFIRYIKDQIEEYNKFDQGIRGIYKDLIINFIDDYRQTLDKMNELMNKYSDSIIDYDYHDPDLIQELGKLTGLYGKQMDNLIDIYKSLYYNK